MKAFFLIALPLASIQLLAQSTNAPVPVSQAPVAALTFQTRTIGANPIVGGTFSRPVSTFSTLPPTFETTRVPTNAPLQAPRPIGRRFVAPVVPFIVPIEVVSASPAATPERTVVETTVTSPPPQSAPVVVDFPPGTVVRRSTETKTQ